MLRLVEINTKLAQTDEDLATAITKLFPLEMKYQLRLDDLELASARANQAGREAEARGIIMREPIYLEYQEAKMEVRILYQRLDSIKEISRNIRNMAFNND